MSQFLDDKSDHCITFILHHLSVQDARYKAEGIESPCVLFVGLNGLQGVGKTTLVGNGPQTWPFSLSVCNPSMAVSKSTGKYALEFKIPV